MKKSKSSFLENFIVFVLTFCLVGFFAYVILLRNIDFSTILDGSFFSKEVQAVEEDVYVTFNGLTIDENSYESFTNLELTYLIYADSIIYENDSITFAFDLDSFSIRNVDENALTYKSISAYNVNTNELLSMFCYDTGSICYACIECNGVAPSEIGLCFSGCLYDENVVYLDDYIYFQKDVSDSQIAMIKLFN